MCLDSSIVKQERISTLRSHGIINLQIRSQTSGVPCVDKNACGTCLCMWSVPAIWLVALTSMRAGHTFCMELEPAGDMLDRERMTWQTTLLSILTYPCPCATMMTAKLWPVVSPQSDSVSMNAYVLQREERLCVVSSVRTDTSTMGQICIARIRIERPQSPSRATRARGHKALVRSCIGDIAAVAG
ncbi:hypothetical protein MRB53_042137 [Persea americana]|nr:hypothetical protein MRB53_042137 [Persea americana]